ncbi:1-deoxy-D-xylulose-5-phosphate synthase [Micromonospora sp. WMMC241]|uniref:1-deoxy-D-xylulose-5-phosphate synthase n=1 Tax=Micromonospora sp. WMMC241 TaxID=3015159 RepID=UPI0022B69D05|nr:1-deoxy-D-xylulose-5-phosphate synthase [Micromonospora sp. WMMC241]MCZ7440042.1 1-deoxy-D-xylulose-5-phosphate synthase [Micromonospora sp. WMMC241]
MLTEVHTPHDLKRLNPAELATLSAEIRAFLVASVSRTGGHLGPNLGVVELTIALHRVFDSPHDSILWDTGHQAYVHKLLTGRHDFSRLRQSGGLSGYPSRAESDHDLIENSHASTALSYADGIARARQILGVRDRSVVAVVGDGALTGGMAWEALNNIASATDRPVVIVLNDNGRSYAPTVGGLARHLSSLRDHREPAAGPSPAHPGVFAQLGLHYIGPVDGHDTAAVEEALTTARALGAPVVVHCVTRKGCGYPLAESDDRDCFHGIGVIDSVTGQLITNATAPSWTSLFGDELVQIGAERPDVVAITAAMLQPVGLQPFAEKFPDRVIDVGIAEQHAATCAAGLAAEGLHPVVAVYATFLNRAFDQVLMDVALHRAGVTFVLDRAGITGDDGPSHNGMWDMSVLHVVPGLRIAAPRDGSRLRELLREAVAVADVPTVVRFPKGSAPEDIEALEQRDGVDIIGRFGSGSDLLLVAVGVMAGTCLDAARQLAGHGIGVTVVDPRWVRPVNPALLELARQHRTVATVEDNLKVSGVGAAFAQAVSDNGIDTPCLTFGIPSDFLAVASRSQLLAEVGLTAGALVTELRRLVTDSLTTQ